MIRPLIAGCLLVALAAVACSPRDEDATPTSAPDEATATPADAATASPDATVEATEPPITTAPEFEVDRAMAHIEVLAGDIGERVSGTDAATEATEYIAGEFESYGYDTSLEPFEYDGERYGLSYIELPEGELTGYQLEGSIGGTVTAPTVFLGLGQEDDYAGKVVAERIAIVERGVISFEAKYEAAREAGAVGMVVINDEPGALIFANLDTRSMFPVIGVAQEAGDALMTIAENEAEITLTVPEDDIGNAVNVVAKAPGTETCEIIVGGHHDTVPASPGANDNASGVAHVLELARAMSADGMDEGLCFATFGAEEHGLFGSREMATTLEDEGALPELMVNLDVTGVGQFVEVIGEQALREEAIAIGQDLGIDVVSSSLPPNAGSDHQSFAAVDVDVLFFTSGDFTNIHTPQDTIDDIEPEEVERIGKVALVFLQQQLERIARG